MASSLLPSLAQSITNSLPSHSQCRQKGPFFEHCCYPFFPHRFLPPSLPAIHSPWPLPSFLPSFLLTSVTLFASFLLPSSLCPSCSFPSLLLPSKFSSIALLPFSFLPSFLPPSCLLPRSLPSSYYPLLSLPPSIPISLLSLLSSSPASSFSSRHFLHPAPDVTLFTSVLFYFFFFCSSFDKQFTQFFKCLF